MDVLVTQIIPTSKYFEVQFDHVQGQIDDLKDGLKAFRSDLDKRFEQVIAAIERLGDKLDYRDEKQRKLTLRMFTIAIGISILGALGAFLRSMGII